MAAFLVCLDRFYRQWSEGKLEDGIQVVYVSPLKALSNDIQRNLQTPLAEISRLAEAAGLDATVFNVAAPEQPLVVAPPSEDEEKMRGLIAAGKVTHSTIWRTCGAVALNGSVVLGAEVALNDKHVADEETAAQKKADELDDVRASAKEALSGLDGDDLSQLSNPELAKLVKVVFASKNERGASKLTSKPQRLEFLKDVDVYQLLGVVPPRRTRRRGSDPQPTAATQKPKKRAKSAPSAIDVGPDAMSNADVHALLAVLQAEAARRPVEPPADAVDEAAAPRTRKKKKTSAS